MNTAEELEACLSQSRNDEERAALLAHATEPGECDAEYCPWQAFDGNSNLCCRNQTHHPNCRCYDCCADDDDND